MSIEKKIPIIVLGMHRSGTSCLAGSLQDSGVYFGDVSLENKYNKKGNRENINIMNLNEKILNYNNGSWDNPPRAIKWTNEHKLEAASIINHFENTQSSYSWGFKDPRTILNFQFWDGLLPNVNLVGTIRSPYNVAQSLNARDTNFSIEKGLQLWLKYNETLLRLLNNKPFPLISFDLNNQHYEEKLYAIKESLSLNNITNEIFFDRKLRSHINPDNQKYSERIATCYAELTSFLT